MNDTITTLVYDQYTKDCFHRLGWISCAVSVCELCMMFLDFQSGFFSKTHLNHLNLLAETMLVVSSTIFWLLVFLSENGKIIKETKQKVHAIIGYRIIVMIAIILFMFTDIYVRHKAIGAYIVFLFVLEITPAYNKMTNWIQFTVLGLAILVFYSTFVSKRLSTLFSTTFVLVAFAISTSYLRKYFVRQYKNYFRLQEANKRFKNLSDQTVTALASAVEAKDPYTKGHSQRVAKYSRMIAEKLGYDESGCDDIFYIGLMHDIGKIGILDSVITKKGKLTDEEFSSIKRHPAIGHEILKQITELPGISEGARWHHERYDGKGYPDGLSGENIPEIPRIIAVADAYDAMTSNRSYRDVMKQEEVRSQIEQNLGKQFDPRIGAIMLEMIDNDVNYAMREK